MSVISRPWNRLSLAGKIILPLFLFVVLATVLLLVGIAIGAVLTRHFADRPAQDVFGQAPAINGGVIAQRHKHRIGRGAQAGRARCVP